MFDIDFESVKAGSVLSEADCEKLFGVTYGVDPVQYQFKLMQLSDYVERELAKRGDMLTVVCDGRTVRVLSHEEASVYNQRHFDNAIKKMRKCNRRLTAVDIREMSQEQIAQHDKSLVRQSRILMAIKSKTRDVAPEPRKIERPVMFKRE